MELSLTEDQELFHETTVRFIEAELPVEATRKLHDDPHGFDRGWWAKAAELGWFTMLVSEKAGGGSVSGSGLIDASLIAEELGRFVQPGPFVPTNVVAEAISMLGTEAQQAAHLDGIMAGTAVATWAYASIEGNWDEGAGLDATASGDGYELNGVRGFVQDLGAADLVLVAATIDGVCAQFLVPTGAAGLTVTELDGLDLSRRMAHATFEGVSLGADALLGGVGATEALERQLQTALALACSETVGAIDWLFDTTVQYAKDRTAFGRPIGSFQSLKHLLADEALHLETCKAGAVALVRAVQSGDDNASEVASMVAAYIGDMAHQLAQMALQVHGGIGFTWEHDLHLYMRRIQTNTALYGDPTWHRERVCGFHGLARGGAA